MWRWNKAESTKVSTYTARHTCDWDECRIIRCVGSIYVSVRVPWWTRLLVSRAVSLFGLVHNLIMD